MKLGTVLNAQALRYPDRLAAASGTRRLSYRELDTRSDRLANALRARGLEYGDRVAMHLENSVEFVEAFYGVAKAGGIMVLVNTRLTAREIAVILSSSLPKFYLFDPARRQIVVDATKGVNDITLVASTAAKEGDPTLAQLIHEGSAERPPALPPEVEDLLYSYTSGTTGTPKGAVRAHGSFHVQHGMMNVLQWELQPGDKVLAMSPLSVSAGLARLGNALGVGGTLVILPKFDATAMAEAFEREKITVAGMVPTIIRLTLPEIRRTPERFKSLRVVVSTGEAFSVELKRELLSLLPNIRLHSFYALTEAGAVTNLDPEEQLTHPASVGRVCAGVEVRIVDDKRNDVASGETGEIAVRCGEPGRYITMRCYLDPAANAESIVDGWVFTGDMGYFDADGFLYLVDRKKDMIVSGGFNIYSREVELALLSHPAVLDAAVVGAPDATFGESVVAVIELKPGAKASEDALVDHCKDLIAGYKKPKRVLFRALPRNSTGKVQKNLLRDEIVKIAR
jgi:acyl-CoA synthetase (AMP-forming)/AMP-acid ligase II